MGGGFFLLWGLCRKIDPAKLLCQRLPWHEVAGESRTPHVAQIEGNGPGSISTATFTPPYPLGTGYVSLFDVENAALFTRKRSPLHVESRPL